MHDHKDIMGIETGRFRVDHYFEELEPDAVIFYEEARPFEEPGDAYKTRIKNWDLMVQKRKDFCEKWYPENRYVIKRDNGRERDELHVVEPEERVVMHDGDTLNMSHYQWDGQRLKVWVYPIEYSEWMACMSSNFTRTYQDAHGWQPYAGIGASMIIETSDGYIPLTLRDIETPNYPWHLFTHGGAPKPGEGASEAVLKEMVEETGLSAGEHFDPRNMRWMAMVSDTHWMGGRHERPDFVGVARADATFEEMFHLNHEKTLDQKKKEADIKSLIPYLADPDSLDDNVFMYGNEMCPPTEASLSLYSYKKRSESKGKFEAAKRLVENAERLKKFKRGSVLVPEPRVYSV